MYIWEDENWPDLIWQADILLPVLADARYRQGKFLGMMRSLGFQARLTSELNATTEDVIKTSAIEGEVLNPASVRSSVARRLGLPEGGWSLTDRKVDGVVDKIQDATRNYQEPLTIERLFGWRAVAGPSPDPYLYFAQDTIANALRIWMLLR